MKQKPQHGGTLMQSLSASDYDALPPTVRYVGDDPELANLRNKDIPTRDVEKLIYIGERENVLAEVDGAFVRPWLYVYVWEADDRGQAIVNWKSDPLPHYGPNAMSTTDLADLGLTDAELAKLAKKLLDEAWVPDRLGPSDKRRELFERVMAASQR